MSNFEKIIEACWDINRVSEGNEEVLVAVEKIIQAANALQKEKVDLSWTLEAEQGVTL